MNKKIIIIIVILVIGLSAYFMFFHKKTHVIVHKGTKPPENPDQFDQAQDIAHGSEYLPHA